MPVKEKPAAIPAAVWMICLGLSIFCFVRGMSLAEASTTLPDARSVDTDLQTQQVVLIDRVQQGNQSRQAAGSGIAGSRVAKSRDGDRLYIVQETDTTASIAFNLAGNSNHWPEIATYNDLDYRDRPVTGQLLYVPQKFGPGGQRGRQSDNIEERVLPKSTDNKNTLTKAEILDREIARHQLSAPAKRARNTHQSNPVSEGSMSLVERDVDMFVGEARVFGTVAVERVAVGNGGILRAEVLENGDLLAIAQAAGSSSLHLWHKDNSRSSFNIRISAEDPEIRVRLDKTIRMRVKMIEFRKTALQRIGIDWGDSIEGPVFATVGDGVSNSLFRPDQNGLNAENATLPFSVKPFSSYFGIATQLSSRINLLVNNGDAEMLAEPVLSCENGGTARFLAGGEVPYPTIGSNGQTAVEFREYGIRLEISPRADDTDYIQADIMTEVSSIDSSVTVMGAPGLLTRRTQTTVSAKAGNTIVIAGLMQIENGQDTDRLPGLGRVPVLGRLFRSDSDRHNVSELVIFITPEVIEPGRHTLSQKQQGAYRHVTRELDNAASYIESVRAD